MSSSSLGGGFDSKSRWASLTKSSALARPVRTSMTWSTVCGVWDSYLVLKASMERLSTSSALGRKLWRGKSWCRRKSSRRVASTNLAPPSGRCSAEHIFFRFWAQAPPTRRRESRMTLAISSSAIASSLLTVIHGASAAWYAAPSSFCCFRFFFSLDGASSAATAAATATAVVEAWAWSVAAAAWSSASFSKTLFLRFWRGVLVATLSLLRVGLFALLEALSSPQTRALSSADETTTGSEDEASYARV
mmetsp:Transcript_17234/g.52381  ORF Transcript_17234/g.52381 Transcript_17234/m.52381 type:complete len:248 (-) Transcript_17234:986-1729(-)